MQVSGNLHLLERHLQVVARIKEHWEAREPLSLEEIHHPLCQMQVEHVGRTQGAVAH